MANKSNITKRGASKKRGRGRPPLYPLTAREVSRGENLINSGYTANEIQARTNFHEFAILRVRRAM